MLDFKVTYSKHLSKMVEKFITYYPEEIDKAVRRVTDWSKTNIIKLTPVKTGAARASWIVENAGYLAYRIISAVGRGAKYTPYLEYGTGLYGASGNHITPKSGKYLVFPIIEGNTLVRWVKIKSVRGQAGHFMVQRTQRDALPRLTNALKKTIRKTWVK